MTRLVLSDSLIREALSPDPHTVAPAGVLAQITADVARTPQRRTLRFPALPESRRLAWVVLGAATLLALLGALLVAGGTHDPFEATVVVPPVSPSASPVPAPSTSMVPTVAELKADGDSGLGFRLLGIDDERAWAAMGDGLWSRTSAGWSGPISVEETAIYPRMLATIRGIADLGDGRLAIATDTGLWVGNEGAWTRAWDGAASDVAMAPDGRLWVSGSPDRGESSLRALRETGAGWQQDWSGCRAGGNAIAIAADGSIWTSGITYSSAGGVARAKDGACEELFPLGEGNGYEVPAIAASPSGAVAVLVMDPLVDDQFAGAHVVEWQDGRWTELRGGQDLTAPSWHALAYTSDGALWATFGAALNRYANGSWQVVAAAEAGAPISAAFDGTVWYVRPDGVVDRVLAGDPRVETVLQRDAASPLDLDGYASVLTPVSATDQWFVGPGSGRGLVAWHRTATGWTGPYVVEPDPAKAGFPRAVTLLPDGRLAVSAEHGLWVGIEGSWTRVREGDSAEVAVDGDGALWVGPKDGAGLMAYTETARGWEPGRSCPGGGGIAATGPDGVVWSAPATWQSGVAVLRVADGRCEEIVIAPDVTAQVLALAPDPAGGLVAVLGTRADGKLRTQVVRWDGGTVAILRDVAGETWSADLAYGRDGALWMEWNAALARYADGAWTDVAGTNGLGLHATPDGMVWYADEGAGYQPVEAAVPAS
jgi:hypothetical protein